VALYLPYFVGYVSQPLGIGFVAERTYFGTLVALFGPLVLLAFSGGLVGLMHADWRREALPESTVLTVIGAGGIVAGLICVALREPTLGFLIASLAMWAAIAWSRARLGHSPARTATALITIVGLGSILVPEVVYLSDVFASRMNTVFKFYYDAWLLLAIAGPLIALELFDALRAESEAMQPGVRLASRATSAVSLATAALLVLGGALYPVFATQTKSAPFAGRPTLDGMAHLRSGRGDDAGAIDWLRTQRSGGGVVEAVGGDYTDAGRFSTFAGVPTLVGWAGHEVQWRGSNPEIERRKQLAQRVYTDQDETAWRTALQELGVAYIVVGNLEREIYGPDAGAALAQKLAPAYRSGSTTIYALRSTVVAGNVP
jgi:uncharacterized membrane protein